MRRTLLHVVLIVSFVLSTMGVLTHAYQHHKSGKPDPVHPKHESIGSCALCNAFAAFEHAIGGRQAPSITTWTAIPPWSMDVDGVLPRRTIAYLVRGPPVLL